ncbi:MAG: hypothetical protein QOF43_1526 [Gaiellaceae bacterium]|jgi:peptidyl-prolyl cis-trans isomerase A (cyclophilin A)|nr:hypothetical protein [Gaiellaceae bacterium]
MRRLALIPLALALAACGGGGGSSSSSSAAPPPALLHPEKLTAKAPAVFDVTFHTSKGDFVVSAHRAWAPEGADRFYNLAKSHFFDGEKFFRVVPRFVVQFGISPFPTVSEAWRGATIPDDIVKMHNTRGAVSYAAAGPGSRTTQLFINLGNNTGLDTSGFAPFATVTSGMKVVDTLYSGYADKPTPFQGEMQTRGNAWLEEHYPKLDQIESAEITHS